ncbi:MAG: hypothetical protein M2R46_01913 [Verrucomicrobia subdivision 3 bacterium]|nr:hypothetical protein [Limisphaerales bacterium]
MTRTWTLHNEDSIPKNQGAPAIPRAAAANPATTGYYQDDQAQPVQRRAEDSRTQVKPAQPRSIQTTMRPRQVEGYHFSLLPLEQSIWRHSCR